MNCIACGGALRSRWNLDPWRILACRTCGMGALDPRPSPEEIAALYRAEDYYSSHGGSGAETAPFRDADHPSLWARYFGDHRLAPLERVLGGTGALLDVGCSAGGLLATARSRGWHPVVGLELSPVARRAAREDLRLAVVGTGLDDAAIRPGSVDAATFFHVLEHVPDPVAALAQAATLTRPGGLVAVEVPNFRSLAVAVHRQRYRILLPPYHLWHFTAAALHHLFTRAGLAPVRVFTPYAPQGTSHVVNVQGAAVRVWHLLRGGRRRGEASAPPQNSGTAAGPVGARASWVNRFFQGLYWPFDWAAAYGGVGINLYGIARTPSR